MCSLRLHPIFAFLISFTHSNLIDTFKPQFVKFVIITIRNR